MQICYGSKIGWGSLNDKPEHKYVLAAHSGGATRTMSQNANVFWLPNQVGQPKQQAMVGA